MMIEEDIITNNVTSKDQLISFLATLDHSLRYNIFLIIEQIEEEVCVA